LAVDVDADIPSDHEGTINIPTARMEESPSQRIKTLFKPDNQKSFKKVMTLKDKDYFDQ
jgi:hypothetical protein